MKYICIPCIYIYDEKTEGVKFKELPANWHCPRCGVSKAAFRPVAEGTMSVTLKK